MNNENSEMEDEVEAFKIARGAVNGRGPRVF